MRDYFNSLLKWSALGLIALFLMFGGWRTALSYFRRLVQGPEIPTKFGGTVPGPVSPALAGVLAQYQVTSQGIVPASGGYLLTLLWTPGRLRGNEALNDAQHRRLIHGYRVTRRPDIRVYS